MKRRYPVSSSTRTRAAAVGRTLGSCCAVLVTAVSVTDVVSTLPPKKCCDYQVEFGGEIRLACGSGPGIGTHHQQATFRKRPEIPAGQMTQPAADLVAHHSPAYRPAHHEAHPRRLLVPRLPEQVTGDQFPPGAAAAAYRPRELRALPHPCRCGKHRMSPRAGAGPGQALTRVRPLRRRAARMARPARVRMRSRNPCVLARWRLFGWNVRLLTGTPGTQGRDRGTTGTAVRHAKTSPRGAGPMNGTRAGHPRSNRARVPRGRRLPGRASGPEPPAWPPGRPLSPGHRHPGRPSTVAPVPSVTVAVCQTRAEPWP